MMMRILIATDAWLPQVNGVVTTLRNTIVELERLGHAVRLITPELFRTLPCPTYPEIRLALAPGSRVARIIDDFVPDAVHIATEGPLGLATRRCCIRSGYRFTTSYHTQFPEYIHARCRLPVGISYRWMRWFHDAAAGMMVATPSVQQRLEQQGLRNICRWSRGVDVALFKPAPRLQLAARPIFLYVGRVAVEKNLREFLKLALPGTKWVVGDGPARKSLQAEFPDVVFHGAHFGAELARYYQQADAFVFPSRTDTFGLVLIEAMACGTPVAAYPVTGPADVILDPAAGVLSDDLGAAAVKALTLDRAAVLRYAANYSWAAATRQFFGNLRPATTASSLGSAYGCASPQP
jgi:glycosyltransferase involved in cell wall biosynthesis